ncbi:MAG TPA: hypothetical protein VNA04_06015 [Thermoanaerobaculia bacterium]|nr:hypothetical protein [Thermoanaerobaculia bacterium]
MIRARLAAVLLLAFAAPAAAQVVAGTSRGVLVAHDGIVELFDESARPIWSAPGVDHAAKVIVAGERAAIVDPWANQVRIVALRNGDGTTTHTAETPVDALFLHGDLYLLARDARVLERIGADGARTSVNVAADPAFLRQSSGLLYVYSRLGGLLQEIDPAGTIRRTVAAGPFAAGMEVDGRTAYFVFPREAKLVSIDLEKMEVRRSVAAGGAPTSVAITRRGSAVSAPLLAIADPAAKRLWITEGSQSVGAAFGRGFLRGLLGLGLFRPRSAEFPTGIDRVVAGGGVTLAFDSATGTLYRARGSGAVPLAQGLAPQSFAVAGNRVALWSGDTLRYEQ